MTSVHTNAYEITATVIDDLQILIYHVICLLMFAQSSLMFFCSEKVCMHSLSLLFHLFFVYTDLHSSQLHLFCSVTAHSDSDLYL